MFELHAYYYQVFTFAGYAAITMQEFIMPVNVMGCCGFSQIKLLFLQADRSYVVDYFHLFPPKMIVRQIYETFKPP